MRSLTFALDDLPNGYFVEEGLQSLRPRFCNRAPEDQISEDCELQTCLREGAPFLEEREVVVPVIANEDLQHVHHGFLFHSAISEDVSRSAACEGPEA